ncbi:hypothetical protein [Streptomyces sp. KR80]|uniref:hypothetical protein n=1 Tax=Streptomyces sp. KR80 TaxID=3457426 RepID=UPI003FD019CC
MFPNAAGATEFLRAFKRAVYPDDWKSLRGRPLPPVLLKTGGEGARAAQRWAQVLRALEEALRLDGRKAVSYARPQSWATGHPGEELLTLHVGRLLPVDPPRRTGKLKLRDFELVDQLVELARAVADEPDLDVPELQRSLSGRRLRDSVYELRADKADGGVLHKLAQLATPPEGAGAVVTTLVRLFGKPVCYKLPRRIWAWSWKRRLLKSKKYGWYARWLHISSPTGTFFDRVSDALTPQAVAMRGSAEARERALFELEKLLLRALLGDLHRRRAGRFGPWGRRRRTRRVVLLALPPNQANEAGATDAAGEAGTGGAAEARDVVRFLRAYRSAIYEPGSGSLLVFGVGCPDGYELEEPGQEWDWQRSTNLAVPAQQLTPMTPGRHTPRILQPTVQDADFEGGGLPVSALRPQGFPWGPRPEFGTELAAVTVALALAAYFVADWRQPPPDTHCLDGSPVAMRVEPEPLPGGPFAQGVLKGATVKDEYDAARQRIDELNERAVAAEKKGETVRKVVYLGSSVSADPEEAEYNGEVPELRGIWLAQARLNSEAAADPENSKVRLVVDVRDTGHNFKNAERVAQQVVAETKEGQKYQDHRTVVGVIGFSESRAETKAAAATLNDGRVPVISTTASANEMQEAGEYYRPLAPSNDRETRVEAKFAHSGPIIEESSDPRKNTGYCVSATRAVVVKDPTDLYSDDLGDRFRKNFPGPSSVMEYPGGVASSAQTAEKVCARMNEEGGQRTVLYWASRVENFNAFLNDYVGRTECAYRNLTVIGANELTNSALAGKFDFAKKWLRLYYTAHVLPVRHEDMSGEAERFTDHYAYYAGEDDPWFNDGHGPLGHDAVRVLWDATVDAKQSSEEQVDSVTVKSKLDNEIRFQGVSGVIHYQKANESKPPLDKALVIVRYAGNSPGLVLRCGAFSLNDERDASNWGPDGAYDCPQDTPN